jgi:hypothetical protein
MQMGVKVKPFWTDQQDQPSLPDRQSQVGQNEASILYRCLLKPESKNGASQALMAHACNPSY